MNDELPENLPKSLRNKAKSVIIDNALEEGETFDTWWEYSSNIPGYSEEGDFLVMCVQSSQKGVTNRSYIPLL